MGEKAAGGHLEPVACVPCAWWILGGYHYVQFSIIDLK